MDANTTEPFVIYTVSISPTCVFRIMRLSDLPEDTKIIDPLETKVTIEADAEHVADTFGGGVDLD